MPDRFSTSLTIAEQGILGDLLATTNCTCRRFVSKDTARKPLFPVTLTKGESLSTSKKVCSRVNRSGSAVLRKPDSGDLPQRLHAQVVA